MVSLIRSFINSQIKGVTSGSFDTISFVYTDICPDTNLYQ